MKACDSGTGTEKMNWKDTYSKIRHTSFHVFDKLLDCQH